MHWRRILVDSRYRTKDSLSNSDFFVELPYPVTISKGSTMLIDGVCLSHSWSTVQLNVNDRLYVYEEPVGQSGTNRTIQIAEGTYNAVTLKDEILAKLNAGTVLPGQYIMTVDDGRLTIGNTSVKATQGQALVWGQDYHDNGALELVFTPYPGNPAMELIGLFTNPTLADGTQYIHSTQSMQCAFLDLQYHKQLFLCCPDLGFESNTMDLRGSTDIVRRVLLGGSAQGDVVNDVLQTGMSTVSFGNDTVLHRIRFQVKGWDGKTIGMSNHQISFEIVLTPP